MYHRVSSPHSLGKCIEWKQHLFCPLYLCQQYQLPTRWGNVLSGNIFFERIRHTDSELMNSPLVGEMYWVETCQKGNPVAVVCTATAPHSLGKCIEWKLTWEYTAARLSVFSLPTRWGNVLSGNIFLPSFLRKLPPYWILPTRWGNVLSGNSGLFLFINYQVGLLVLHSPLVGEMYWVET